MRARRNSLQGATSRDGRCDETILASGAGVCGLRWSKGSIERDARHSASAGYWADRSERRRTTLVNVLTGFQTPTSGRVWLDGVATDAMSAHQVRRRGVARTFQSGRLFRDLSVLDNLAVTAVGLGLGRREAAAKAALMLDWIGIGALAEHGAGALPYTDERRVAIGRALMQKPAYLLLDEPAAGMSRAEAAELASLIRRIVAELECG